ncbi:unnamed protein product [Urochloa decumbens]|uniref:Uncharacterized protein n=1 Tax=Urochloa decumbens TaxID=240449 RepID=A0ABC9B1Q8_9POAL
MSRSPACARHSIASASTASADTVTVLHELRVEDYSQTKGIGASTRISSFVAGTHSWSITFYNDIGSCENTEWVFFRLRLEQRGKDGDFMVRIKYSFLDEAGNPIPSSTRTSDLWTFRRTGETASKLTSCKREDMESTLIKREDMESNYLRDDKARIRCDVTVIEVTPMSAAVPQSDLHRHLADLLDTGVGADVTFEVGGETFAVHKNVLAARSSVFKEVFFGTPLKEKVASPDIISIIGMEPRLFKAMLHFIYTDSLPKIDWGDEREMTQHLLVAAYRCKMQRLVSICEFTLCLSIDTSVVVSTLVLAEKHGCKVLKEGCFKFLKSNKNYKNVLVGDDLQYLERSYPSLLDELNRFGVCGFLRLNNKIIVVDLS